MRFAPPFPPPSSRHCRDARVYGYTTAAMHDMTRVRTPPIGAVVLRPSPSAPAPRSVTFRFFRILNSHRVLVRGVQYVLHL